MPIESFKDLLVWRKAMKVTKETYQIASKLPQYELYGLGSQMRRASVSIACNIAEGKQRKTLKDYVHFLHIADGSASELETLLLLTKELYPAIEVEQTINNIDETQRMLSALMKKLSAAI